ncbi:MAG: tetracycline resistance MFS efflux pump, partial [Burkholderiales bacterium]
MSETHSSPPRRAAFIFVFITVLLDMLALGIVIPVLPKLVVDFLSGDTARAAEIYGVFGTVFALM